MNRSIIISSVLHTALIFITAMSLPFLSKKPFDIPPIVSVELIQIAEKTNIPFAPKAKKIIDKTLNFYFKDIKASQKQNMIDNIHLVSLARNLRVLGAWVYLHQKGKKNYLKSFKKTTWHQINIHLDHLKLYELKDLLGIIFRETIS